jgi:hypothetical protein
MRKIIFIAIFFNIISGYSQSYRLIKKAEKKIIEKKYSKAQKLLEKAAKADYGFCGTAYLEAVIEINRLKFKLYSDSNNEIEMSKFLDKIDELCESKVYTLERIKLALKNNSKEKLNIKIIEALKKENVLSLYSNLALLKLDENLTLKMYMSLSEINKLIAEKNLDQKEALMEYYLNSDYFKYIVNN